MLVLSRLEGEEVFIGDDITLTVVYIGNGKVRLGFTAPRDVAIRRDNMAKTKPSGPAKRPLSRPVGRRLSSTSF